MELSPVNIIIRDLSMGGYNHFHEWFHSNIDFTISGHVLYSNILDMLRFIKRINRGGFE